MPRWFGVSQVAGFLLWATAAGMAAGTQQSLPQAQTPSLTPAGQEAPGMQAFGTSVERLRPNYVLGPGDQILIRAFEAEEISERPFRIDGDGFINLPMLGRVRAGGLSVEQLESNLVELLRKYIRQPQVTVTVVQFRSEPVFFVGAFRAPGIYPLQGRRTLVEMLSAIGGLQPNASRRIKVTRRKEFGPIPLPSAAESADGKVTSVVISMGSLRENVNPAEDIVLQPFDVISVERAEMVYVNGEVGKVGAFELGERESVSVIQLLTMAGGLSRDADPAKARVLRPILNTSRRAEIPVNVKRIFEGKDSDFPLLPNDLLFLPKASSWKRNLGRGLLISMPIITTVIYVAVR